MKVVFYVARNAQWPAGKPRERMLAEALGEGVRNHGDAYDIRFRSGWRAPGHDVDVACVVGVKSRCREFMEAHWRAERHTLYFDKGYTRHRVRHGNVKGWEFWRVSVDAFQPLGYFQTTPRPSDRWGVVADAYRIVERAEWLRKPSRGHHVLFAGSSQKYCDWHRLGDATAYAARIIRRIDKATRADKRSRPVVYRPKPSWRDAAPIPGARFSRPPEKITDALEGAHCLVTFGSNAALDAVIVGVPVIVLGDGIARPMAAATRIDKYTMAEPRLPPLRVRRQWCHDLAYCQWTRPEMASGEAWEHLRKQVLGS